MLWIESSCTNVLEQTRLMLHVQALILMSRRCTAERDNVERLCSTAAAMSPVWWPTASDKSALPTQLYKLPTLSASPYLHCALQC
jgi:hypothetical protein